MENEFKPCPNCGLHPVVGRVQGLSGPHTQFAAMCGACSNTGPRVELDHDDMKALAEAWNREVDFRTNHVPKLEYLQLVGLLTCAQQHYNALKELEKATVKHIQKINSKISGIEDFVQDAFFGLEDFNADSLLAALEIPHA